MYHPSLEPWIAKALDLKLKLARFILKTEPLAKDLSERQKIDYGLTHFVYYQCSSCADIYYSGTRVCHRAAGIRILWTKEKALLWVGNDDQPDPDDLLCLKCTGVGNTICVRHGPAYIEYKCNFCCSIATFTCHVYYCAACHSRAGNIGAAPSCAGADSCPLKVRFAISSLIAMLSPPIDFSSSQRHKVLIRLRNVPISRPMLMSIGKTLSNFNPNPKLTFLILNFATMSSRQQQTVIYYSPCNLNLELILKMIMEHFPGWIIDKSRKGRKI